MRRTILREVNPISVHTVRDNVIREQTQQVLPKIYCRTRIGRLCPPGRLRQQIRPFATAISLALLMGSTSVLVPRSDARASAAEPFSLTRLKPSTVLSPMISAANTSESVIQTSRPIAKPLWVPKQTDVNEPVRPLVIARIHEDPTVNYQVQPEDTVEVIASNHQISEQELVKVNRLNNPNVIRVDQVLRIPSSQLESSYAVGGEGSVPTTIPSVITAAQPSGVTLPVSTTQVASMPIPIAPTTDDSKFRVATVATNQPQAPIRGSEPEAIQVTSPNSQAEATASASVSMSATPSQQQTTDLQSDIQKLQAKYAARETVQAVTAVDNQGNVADKSMAVATTDLSPKQIKILQLDRQKSQDQDWAEPAKVHVIAPTTVALTPKQKSAATVSAGPRFYTPVIKRTVFPQQLSPELPPLAPLDTYLPKENLPGPQQYIWPTKGVLTSGFGKRWGRMHRGIDVAAPVGTPVVAAAVGVVVQAGWNSGGYGNLVNVLHPDGSLTRYAHNKRLLVRPGQEINQGQQIAEMGSTGRSTGPHLHFEIHPPGKGAVNPMSYLSRG